MAFNVILNTGFIVGGLLPLAFVKKPTDPMKQTSIAIGVGSGGSVPHVAVWGEDGARITQVSIFRSQLNLDFARRSHT